VTTDAWSTRTSQVYLRSYTSAEWQRQQHTTILDPSAKMTLEECQARRAAVNAGATLKSRGIIPNLYIDCIDASYLEGPGRHNP